MKMMRYFGKGTLLFRLVLLIQLAFFATLGAAAPLRLEITEGVVEPLAFAAPAFIAENAGGADYASQLAELVVQDLTSSGLFRAIPSRAHISKITSFSSPVQFVVLPWQWDHRGCH